MGAFLNISTIVLRICYVAQLTLGILLWTNNAENFRNLHITLGIIIVLGLWATGVALVMRGGSPVLAGALIVYGVVVLVVGLNQAQWLGGTSHWVIQVVHLLLGLGTMALTESTRLRIRVGSVAASRA